MYIRILLDSASVLHALDKKNTVNLELLLGYSKIPGNVSVTNTVAPWITGYSSSLGNGAASELASITTQTNNKPFR